MRIMDSSTGPLLEKSGLKEHSPRQCLQGLSIGAAPQSCWIMLEQPLEVQDNLSSLPQIDTC